jgi:hypothetical protein
MPRYEFPCEKCKKPFELTMAISEREKASLGVPPAKAPVSRRSSAAS